MSTELKLKKDQKILKEIKRTIMEVAKEIGIEIDKIILFGSRARGEYRDDSDWDILVVTKKKIEKERLNRFYILIKKRLSAYLWALDLIIVSKKEHNVNSKIEIYVNHIAEKQGVIL